MFRLCAQKCWKQSTPFANTDELMGKVVLFPFTSDLATQQV